MFSRTCPFFFQAEDGIRDRSPSRGLGDVYKRQESLNIVYNLADFVNKIAFGLVIWAAATSSSGRRAK